MTSIQASQITLPEIDISNQLDWNTEFLDSPPDSPPLPAHHPPESKDNENMTTGLTRALSLPRQLNNQIETDTTTERKEVINIATSNPSHLYWVPASQHPEIAPAEFEKYVDTHGLMIRKRKSVKRRQSILSVYFTASDQKLLDELAKIETPVDLSEDEEADRKRKSGMRRSVSLHLPVSGDFVRNVPETLVFDRNSSPLDESRALVPKGDRPLLRRGARNNFKRNSTITTRPVLVNRKSESDYMDNKQQQQQQHQSVPIVRSTSADAASEEGVTLSDAIPDREQPLSPVAETVEDVRDLCIATRDTVQEQPALSMSRSVSTSTASSRKSTWSWAFWSDEKNKKNNKIDPVEEPQQPPPQEVSKSSENHKRFTFSSIFKKTNSKQSKGDQLFEANSLYQPPPHFELNKFNTTRLPLHVERAIYKLSHVKLANPRRPLHEQVLISNQMFWYLSVVATNDPPTAITHAHVRKEKKKPRKLVKKQRPPPPSSQKKPSKLVGGFMTHGPNSVESSTGFVVPENYLNPKQTPATKKKQHNQKLYMDHKQSDSSSDDSEEEDEEEDDDDDDGKPLAMYKAPSPPPSQKK